MIRDLCLDLGLKPMRGTRRVAIIDDADDLNDEAANAFLKTLEEPPAGAVLILIGTSAEVQLDTIVSRCRVVRFNPLAETELAALLLEQGVTSDPAEARATGGARRGERLPGPRAGRPRFRALPPQPDRRAGRSPRLRRPRPWRSGSRRSPRRPARRASTSAAAPACLMGELARFFRGFLWQTAGMTPPAPTPTTAAPSTALAQRLDPEAVLVLADRCLEADYQIHRKAYLPLILHALTHDLARLANPRS